MEIVRSRPRAMPLPRRRARRRYPRRNLRVAETLVPQSFLRFAAATRRVAPEARQSHDARMRSSGAARVTSDSARRRRSPFVKRIRCFSCSAVVIGAQCTSIRDCIVRYRHRIMARRAVWHGRPRRQQRRRRRRKRRQRRRRSNEPHTAFGVQDANRNVAHVGEDKGTHAHAAAERLADKSRRPRASAKPRFTLHAFRLSRPTCKVGRRRAFSGVPFF